MYALHSGIARVYACMIYHACIMVHQISFWCPGNAHFWVTWSTLLCRVAVCITCHHVLRGVRGAFCIPECACSTTTACLVTRNMASGNICQILAEVAPQRRNYVGCNYFGSLGGAPPWKWRYCSTRIVETTLLEIVSRMLEGLTILKIVQFDVAWCCWSTVFAII